MTEVTTFQEFRLWSEDFCNHVVDVACQGAAHEAQIVAKGIQSDPDIRSTKRYKVLDTEILHRVLEGFDANNVWDFSTFWSTDSLPVV